MPGWQLKLMFQRLRNSNPLKDLLNPSSRELSPLRVIVIALAMWVLAIVPLGFGLPWSTIAFLAGFGAIGATAFAALEMVEAALLSHPRSESPRQTVKRCTTCQTFQDLTKGFQDLSPRVEAIYLEHLIREHGVEP
jgi:hypothetical protein